MKLARSSALNRAPSLVAWYSSRAEKALSAQPQWRGADRHSPGPVVPIPRDGEQTSDLRMHQPDADRQLEAVALPVQTTRQEYLEHVSVVLLQSSNALIADPPCLEERLADVGGEAFNEHSANHPSQDQRRVPVETPDAGPGEVPIEPVRREFPGALKNSLITEGA